MSGIIAAVGVAVAAVGAGYSIATSGNAAKSAQDLQNQQNQTNAQNAAAAKTAAGTAQGTTNADTSNVNSTTGPAAAGVNSGPASTLLTGAGGVDPSKLNLGAGAGSAGALGANTLLGS